MRTTSLLLLLGLWMAIGSGCARSSAKRAMSQNNIHQISIAIKRYQGQHGAAWPDNFGQLENYLGGAPDVFTNPITGENPGYEYVKPAMRPPENTIVIYSLRNGVRDLQQPVGYADGSVRNPAE